MKRYVISLRNIVIFFSAFQFIPHTQFDSTDILRLNNNKVVLCQHLDATAAVSV